MKGWSKYVAGAAAAVLVSFVLFSFSCNSSDSAKSANTAFADTGSAVSIPSDALAVTEAVQSVFRAISSGVLPSIVEIDVVEKKTVQTPSFDGFPFNFFFGPQDGSDGETREYEQSGLGSGVIVRKTGDTYYVLTNNHVAGSANEISVKLNDGRSFSGKLVGADERKDIALVSFETKDGDIAVAVLGDSDTVQPGDICFAMGTPLGYYSSVTQGIISATGRSGNGIGNISDFIQTDAAINQGNSGGALVNIYGEVIGINTWIASQSGGSQGLGFAIPINNVKKAIDDFIDSGKVTYGWIGVSLVEITDTYKESLGVGKRNGAFASQVFIGSPAQKAGMQAGDFVINLNGKDVKTVDQLVREVGDLNVGETAQFTVLRGGKEMQLKVKIEGRDNEIASNNTKLWPGFIAYPIDDSLREQLKIEKNVEGVVVTNLMAKSPAAALRLQNGDVVTAVNGKKVTNLSEFYSALDLSGNKEIWFDVYSDGHTISTGRYKL
ncbi:Do family serine endopeptidase [Treponema brennaborense]|uniref:Protease Do n=1 Tax=Treponema brennaborense (strain DSM 12168 / CIP 105900 / DD5/3) TaxID=906968 RepID=F4LQ35_TREBD|nr:Do family serine endopeptidase [Treponema brennaborense]AEE17113.1 protease Do [Treponema brennaborense DSM 12168]